MRARRKNNSTGICDAFRRSVGRACATLAMLLLVADLAIAAGGSPQLALVSATPYRSTAGAVTVAIEGNFNFEDTVQLPLPVEVIVAQGARSTRFDLAGHAFTTIGGAAEQPDAGPGVIVVKQHQMLLVLPPGFATGAATVQIVARYQDDSFASNTLEFTL